MGYCENCLSSVRHAPQGAFDVVRVESTEALVQNEEFRLLQERARKKHSRPLSLREAPASIAHHLVQTGRQAIEEFAQTQFPTDPFGLDQV